MVVITSSSCQSTFGALPKAASSDILYLGASPDTGSCPGMALL